MRYAVHITDDAAADMEAIYDYIANRLLSPENAAAQYRRLAEAILSLDMFPERFGVLDSEPEHSMGIRRMTVGHYLVCYIADAKAVTVTAVLYGASDVHRRLNARWDNTVQN